LGGGGRFAGGLSSQAGGSGLGVKVARGGGGGGMGGEPMT
jgi:hypothetical protein